MKTIKNRYTHYNISDIVRLDVLPKGYTGAVEFENGSRQTFLNGQPHSFDDEPADIDTVRCFKRWYSNGRLHRVGLAAGITDDGNGAQYWLNGKLYFSKHFNPIHQVRSYWKDCWNVYRTPENEQLIMAGLLSGK